MSPGSRRQDGSPDRVLSTGSSSRTGSTDGVVVGSGERDPGWNRDSFRSRADDKRSFTCASAGAEPPPSRRGLYSRSSASSTYGSRSRHMSKA